MDISDARHIAISGPQSGDDVFQVGGIAFGLSRNPDELTAGHGTSVRCPTGNRESQRAKTRDIEAIFAGRGLFRSLRLAKARHAIPFLPLVALLEHRHSLVPFEYVALGAQIR